MALTLNNLVGFETGGLEEASAVSGAPDVYAIGHSGDYGLGCIGTSTRSYDIAPFEDVADAGDDQVVGFCYQVNDITPPAESKIFVAMEGATELFSLNHEVDGDLRIDFIAGGSETIVAPFTVNTWHLIEIRWQHLDSGAFDLHMDEVSKTSVSGKDMNAGGTFDTYRLGCTTGNDGLNFRFDDFYCYSGASGVGDFLGECEVFRYQANTNSATPDTGDALDYGDPNALWQEVGTTPGDADEIGYTTYPTTGAVYTDDVESGLHYRHGPHGDANIDGTIKGAKFLHQLRGVGAGTYYKRYGNDGDGLTDVAVVLTTAYVNYMTVSELATVVPLVTEHFAIGFKNIDERKDLYCKGMWAFILHVPPTGPPVTQPYYHRTGGVPGMKIGRPGSVIGRSW